MKKLFCLLIVASLLFSMTVSALAETTEADEATAIREQLGRLRDFVLSIMNSQKETAAEKQLKAWKAKGAYAAKTQLYILQADPQNHVGLDICSLLPLPDFSEILSSDELYLDIQRRMPALSALSLNDLRGRIFVDHPSETHVLDVYAASCQDGAEALELTQAFSDAFCALYAATMNPGTPVVLSLPALLD